MPNTDWVSRTLSGLQDQATAMHDAIALNVAGYGSTAPEMAQMQTLIDSFSAARTACNEPSTATEVTTAELHTQRDLLVAFMRSLGRRIQANPAVTNAMKVAATLPVRSTEPTPSPVPGTRAKVQLEKVVGLNIVVLVTDELTPTKKARPAGYACYELFSYVVQGNEPPPSDLEKWRYEGASTRALATIGYNAEDVGKRVYIIARWVNRKAQAGNISDPLIAVVATTVAV